MSISNFSWNGLAIWMYEAILYIAVAYSWCVSLIMVTITRHIFINISQTEHFSAVKFAIGYEKNMSFLVIAKSPKVWQKGWKDRTGLLFMSDVAIEIWMIYYLSKILPVEFLKIFFTYGKFTLKYYQEKKMFVSEIGFST